LRGHRFKSLEDMCVFLILARRGLYGRMGMAMSFAGGGMRKTEQRMGMREHRMMAEQE
jgi:hypothetical protein